MMTEPLGTVSAPASVGVDAGGRTFGVFYSSSTRTRHIAPYISQACPPTYTLCGRAAGTPTRSIEAMCRECETTAARMLGRLEYR